MATVTQHTWGRSLTVTRPKAASLVMVIMSDNCGLYLLSPVLEATAGSANVYARDCAEVEGKHSCDKVSSGTTVLRYCICDGNLCNESWDSAGSTTASHTDRPTDHTTGQPSHGTDATTTTTTTSSAMQPTVLYPLCTWIFLLICVSNFYLC